MNIQEHTIGRSIWGVGSVLVFLLIGCSSSPVQTSPKPTAQRLLGKTQTQILQCAGQPIKQIGYGANGVVLRYYKKAPMFEGSDPASGANLPALHHGCWASVLIEKDQVTGVEFRGVPDKGQDNECEEIFRQCIP